MATIEFTGIDEYAAKLRALDKAGTSICRAAVYDGAGVVADAIRQRINSLHTITPTDAIVAWRETVPVDGITEAQKEGLLDGMHLQKIRDENGFICTEVGFAGYNTVKTHKFPDGQPNALIARSIESGSSARQKQPFIRPTVNQVRGAAETAMEIKINDMISKIME